MKKLTPTLIILIILAAAAAWVGKTYNSLVKVDESVTAAWSQVENVYQRRADLIPNLVATVKGYAEHESSTLEAVVAARSKVGQVNVNDLSEQSIKEFQDAQSELSSTLSRLLVVVEQYPDLKANQGFLDLQAQLEGTENRIATERQNFNNVAKAYNTTVRTFPTNIVAGIFNFDTKGYFTAAEGADQAPVVAF